ncbi:transcription initiation factor TFIID subunit 4-like isoform X1 [Neodiprion pinetum]|uniref:transcription initiation factor TFIID subunit 4-like isoform X1 n=1 Tax=Neodiprion pinetum TaxID=441929 RepID=UPI001EDDABFB|nr:sialidase-like isoform X1 [Neodiprion pinetum]
MGEPASGPPPQSNGGVKQKPTSLNLGLGPFYRGDNARGTAQTTITNDRNLRHITGNNRSSRTISVSNSGEQLPAVGNTSGTQGHHHQQQLASSRLPSATGIPPWGLSEESETLLEPHPPPPPAPSAHTPTSRSGRAGPIGLRNGGLPAASSTGQLPARSPNHGNYNGHGFSLYTPPAPIPGTGSSSSSSGASKVRGLSNGLPNSSARRPSTIPVSAFCHGVGFQFGEPPPPPPPSAPARASSPSAPVSRLSAAPANGHAGTVSPSPCQAANTEPVLRRPHSTVSGNAALAALGYSRDFESAGGVSMAGASLVSSSSSPSAPSSQSFSRHVMPPSAIWNGQLLHQPLPRRPHSIAATPTTAGPASSSVLSLAPAPPANSSSARTPGEPIQWGPSGMVLHQPVPRRPFAAVQPPAQPQPPTPTTSLSVLGNPGNSNTWSAGGSHRPRPHSIATTPQGSAMAPASPSDSGYRSLPSASSDYQLLKSPSQTQTNLAQGQQNQSAARRLSLPSAQTLLRVTAPKPSPTFHGLPFRPFTCGLSPNGNPIFLGCTHLHGPANRVATPVTSPAKSLTTSQAIQQLLAQPRNGFKIVDDKVSLFIEILDTQERFAKVWNIFLIEGDDDDDCDDAYRSTLKYFIKKHFRRFSAKLSKSLVPRPTVINFSACITDNETRYSYRCS